MQNGDHLVDLEAEQGDRANVEMCFTFFVLPSCIGQTDN